MTPRRALHLFGSTVLISISVYMATNVARAESKATDTSSGVLFCCLQKKWPDISYDRHSGYGFIPETGQNLAWDHARRTWIDVKTNRPVMGDCKNLAQAAFACCLQKKWPKVTYDKQSGYAYVPETHQNLAWDKEKQSWIDTKTPECICPTCEPKRTSQQPTPSTTDKVTDALKTIGSSISIGIGGGGSSEHRHTDRVRGEDRTKTAEKLNDHKTRATKTSSSSGKTVTSACKCQPCTCSPCRCR